MRKRGNHIPNHNHRELDILVLLHNNFSQVDEVLYVWRTTMQRDCPHLQVGRRFFTCQRSDKPQVVDKVFPLSGVEVAK